MGTCTAAKRDIARTLMATRNPCQNFKKGMLPTPSRPGEGNSPVIYTRLRAYCLRNYLMGWVALMGGYWPDRSGLHAGEVSLRRAQGAVIGQVDMVAAHNIEFVRENIRKSNPKAT